MPFKGALISLTPDAFCAGWRKIQFSCVNALRDISTASNADDLVNAFNTLATARLLTFITLTGHRGTKVERLTGSALYLSATLLSMFDKDVGDYQSRRVIPAHTLVDRLLAQWQEDVRIFLERADCLGLGWQSKRRRSVAQLSLNRCVFYHLGVNHSNAGTTIIRKSIDGAALVRCADRHFGQPLNIGRHFLATQLLISGIDMWLVRVLTGHSRANSEPFSDAMGRPPRYALEQLSSSIDAIFAALDLEPIGGWHKGLQPRTLLVPKGGVPSPLGDPYLHPNVKKNLRVLPPPFDSHTLLAIRTVEDVRSRMLEEYLLPDQQSRLILSLIVFDAMDPIDLRSILDDLERSLVFVGNTAWAIWKREGCSHEICMPLNPCTHMALVDLDTSAKHEWKQHIESVGQWIGVQYPELRWPLHGNEIFEVFAALALRWRRYVCSPSLLTAQSRAVPSATPSRRSLLRLAAGPANDAAPSKMGKAIRQGNSKLLIKGGTAFEIVKKRLSGLGTNAKGEGEELELATKLIEKLEAIDVSSDLRVDVLKLVLMYEAELRLSGANSVDQLNSLKGYVAQVISALELLTPFDDLRDFTGEEIEEWVVAAKYKLDLEGKRTMAVLEDRTRYFGLKRFLRSGAALGWDVPKGLFADDGDYEMFRGMRKSAASILVLKRDHVEVRRLLTDHFEFYPFLGRRALLSSELLEHAALRSMEQCVLRKTCIAKSIDALDICADRFSHLKSMHATRLIPLPKHLSDAIQDIENDPFDTRSRYLFLSDDATDWSDAHAIDDALINALTQATGESSIRKHSLRAAAICNRISPNWERIATALVQGDWTTDQFSSFFDEDCKRGFASFIYGTREAGHGHPLITSVYYFSVWPFLLAGQLRATLHGLQPQSALLARVFGNTDSIRKAKSVAKKTGVPFDMWKKCQQLSMRRVSLPALVPIDPDVIITPGGSGSAADQPEAIACIRFAAKVLLGADIDECAHAHGLATPLASLIASRLPTGDQSVALIKRRHGNPSELALEEDRISLDNVGHNFFIAKLLSASITDLNLLASDIDPARSQVAHLRLNAKELLERIACHLKVLPQGYGLQIRFSSKHPVLLGAPDFAAYGARINVGSNDSRIGAHPLFQVFCLGQKLTSNSRGRAAVIARVLIAATAIVLKLKEENFHE